MFEPQYRKYRRIVFGLLGFGLGAVVCLVLFIVWNLPPLKSLENPRTDLSTQILSVDNVMLGAYYRNEHRVNVRLADLPIDLQNALLATEDVRFYNHSGIDPIGLLNAFASQLTGNKRGGSGLTQQLARNLFDEVVGQDRSIWRKVKEAVASVALERRYTKDEILTAYLNTVPFGGNYYGIQAGARMYFNKNTADLTLPEGAMLIGLLKGPSYYNPFRYPERALDRRNVVMSQMVKYGFLDAAAYDTLKAQPLGISAGQLTHNEGLAPHFRENLRAWLGKWCQDNNKDLYTDGLRVYTTLNSKLQTYAEEAVNEHLRELQPIFTAHLKGSEPWKKDTAILWRAMTRSERYRLGREAKLSDQQIYQQFQEAVKMRVFSWKGPIDTTLTPWDSLAYYAGFLEAGVACIDPKTGHILAWVGGLNHQYFKYDHVQTGKRQVGSTFKPFVYAAYLHNGHHPCEVELNTPVTIKLPTGELWQPQNAEDKYTGPMTLKQALGNSINVVSARVIDKVGPAEVVKVARTMGIQTPLESVHAIALGVSDLSVLELTSAYATFANEGKYTEPVFVSRIEDRFGNVLYEAQPISSQALDPGTAYSMIDMLRYVVTYGTAGGLRWMHKLPDDIDIGGKTGTTQNHADGWFVGITPEFSCGVWVGSSDRAVRFRTLTYGQGGRLAMPIWGKFMHKVYSDKDLNIPHTMFRPPSGFNVQLDCAKYKQTGGSTGGSPTPKPFNPNEY